MKNLQSSVFIGLVLIFILLTFSIGFAYPANFTHSTKDVYFVHEEILYDKFGISNSSRSKYIELSPYHNFEKIRINFTAKVSTSCNLKIKSDIPEIFEPKITIKNSNLPITSNFIIPLKENREIKLEVEIKLRNVSFDKVNDEILRIIDEIKNLTKNRLELLEINSEDGEIDCDDYAKLFVSISNSMNLPARTAFNSNHMWVEVLVPLKNGSYKWIIIDPTNSNNFISYLLSFDLEPECEGLVIEDEVWRFI
jgi:hypothetical protein